MQPNNEHLETIRRLRDILESLQRFPPKNPLEAVRFAHDFLDLEISKVIEHLLNVIKVQHEALKQYTSVCVSVNRPDSFHPEIADEGYHARNALTISTPYAELAKGE